MIRDPRRLGGVELDPDEDRLGPDAWTLSGAELTRALGTGTGPLKARLLDQARVAGLGNLLVDEILWRSGLDPARPAGSLDAPERRRLCGRIRSTLDELDQRGGSHTGDLHEHRRAGGSCPRDQVPFEAANDRRSHDLRLPGPSAMTGEPERPTPEPPSPNPPAARQVADTGTIGCDRPRRAALGRLGRAALAMSVTVAALGSRVAAASAQDGDGSVPATTLRSTRVDDPQATVNAVTLALVAIAALTAVLTVAYWFHTRPERRNVAAVVEASHTLEPLDHVDEEP